MSELQNGLLEELIERAYAQRGYAPLSEQETDQLVTECVDRVEEVSQTERERQETA